MTTYAIGNVRGNYKTLLQLLDKINFTKERDTLWFTGDLVNSGPDSLAVLRFIKDLGSRAISVLGHQELRLLAIAEDVQPKDSNDTFDEILAAPDRDGLLKWLRQLPFLHHEQDMTLVHAGVPAEWSLSQARTLALEAETSLSMGNHRTFLENIFADDPTRWHAKHRGWKRVRFITNAFTRMRYCNATGRLDFSTPATPESQPEGLVPWYQLENRAMAKQNIIFSRWPSLDDQSITGIFPLDMERTDNGSLSALKISSLPQKMNFIAV